MWAGYTVLDFVLDLKPLALPMCGYFSSYTLNTLLLWQPKLLILLTDGLKCDSYTSCNIKLSFV